MKQKMHLRAVIRFNLVFRERFNLSNSLDSHLLDH